MSISTGTTEKSRELARHQVRLEVLMTHAELVELAATWLRNTRRCGVVLTERGDVGRADALGWMRTGHAPYCILVECKRSVSDFKADRYKLCRQDHDWHGIGDERYYFTPSGLLRPEQLPAGWGLLEWDGRIVRRTVKSRSVPVGRLMAAMTENQILIRELRAYQAQGIRYLTFKEQAEALAQRRTDREEVLHAMAAYPLEFIA